MGHLGHQVLITRTRSGADRTAEHLSVLGYCALISPVLHVQPCAEPLPALAGVQALMATSAHAVAALGTLGDSTALPLFCLAGASLDQARTSGWAENLHPAQGDATALARHVTRSLDPAAGPLLWARGRHVALDVKAALQPQGFEVREWIAYEAVPAEALAPDALAAWQKGRIGAVLIHSERGAQSLLHLLERHKLKRDAVAVIAISARTAAPLVEARFAAVHVASRPEEATMLRLLARVLPPEGAAAKLSGDSAGPGMV